MNRAHRRWAVAGPLAGAALLFSAGLASPAGAQGNVGTVKIDNVDIEAVPNNVPHVDDCEFEVEFFGYPASVTATATIFHVPPTGDGSQIATGDVVLDDDDESGGGSAEGFDGSLTFDLNDELAGFDPQPQQGWHLRLEVTTTPDTPGGSKNKVFWVIGCEAPVPPTTGPDGTTTTTPDGTTTTAPGGVTTTAPGAAPGAGPPAAPPAAAAPAEELAFTGSNTPKLALAAVALLLAGATLVIVARRRLTA